MLWWIKNVRLGIEHHQTYFLPTLTRGTAWYIRLRRLLQGCVVSLGRVRARSSRWVASRALLTLAFALVAKRLVSTAQAGASPALFWAAQFPLPIAISKARSRLCRLNPEEHFGQCITAIFRLAGLPAHLSETATFALLFARTVSCELAEVRA